MHLNAVSAHAACPRRDIRKMLQYRERKMADDLKLKNVTGSNNRAPKHNTNTVTGNYLTPCITTKCFLYCMCVFVTHDDDALVSALPYTVKTHLTVESNAALEVCVFVCVSYSIYMCVYADVPPH